jgi:glycosyltransferase involved in cell wall biosynthesis
MHKVLVDLSRIGKNPFNGLYTYSYQMALSFLKLDLKDWELFYFLPKKKFGFLGKNVQYVSQRSIDKFFRFGTSAFDIWHCTTTISNYRPFNSKTKFIFTIHDLNFLIEYPEYKRRNKRLLAQIQKRVDRADHLIVISNFSLAQAKAHLDLGDRPISIVYPGCSLVTDPVAPQVPAYNPERKFFFSIGSLEPRKNFHRLIPLLKDNEYELIIAGLDSSTYKNVIIETATTYGVMDRLRLVGTISEAEKVWYYQHCEAFLFPSFAEGFGSPVVEAMFYGKPVFLSKETSLPEVGGDCAYYFDSFEPEVMKKNFQEGMQHYCETNPQEKIKQRAGMFSYDKMIAHFLAIYEKLV